MTAWPEVSCASCGRGTPVYETVHTGSDTVCCRCFNGRAADRMGLPFVHPEFASMTVGDSQGKEHRLHFRTQLVPAGILIEGFEIQEGHPGGYEFAVLGPFDDDVLDLFSGLLMKIRRAMERRHLQVGSYGREISEERTVCGRIEWDDDHDGRLPMLIIDGEAVSWDDMGRMLMTFEGFQFRLELKDRTDEV